ncbi:hypothetical protein DOTSEDRAFT_38878 [Dothistroma septosporum NZE10]|uniref:F-box domain-containing protein n=1 Tax=Dothistroma septosporum (strain NZE10 / CBS 128990) TaxID=675120 RepID=M2WHY2_DOTSN|nr:hypothetical protein DOTSEDRAFT_38878 [Dothistroma septosporum NZE10]
MVSALAQMRQAVGVSYNSVTTLTRAYMQSRKRPKSASASLRKLPIELIEVIAEKVEPGDLCALRLVCCDLADKLSIIFTSVHFSSKGFRIHSLSNLTTALKIAQHPAFGSASRELHLYVDKMHMPEDIPITPGGFGPWIDWLEADRRSDLCDDQRNSYA